MLITWKEEANFVSVTVVLLSLFLSQEKQEHFSATCH